MDQAIDNSSQSTHVLQEHGREGCKLAWLLRSNNNLAKPDLQTASLNRVWWCRETWDSMLSKGLWTVTLNPSLSARLSSCNVMFMYSSEGGFSPFVFHPTPPFSCVA